MSKAKLILPDKEIELPIIEGTEGEKAIDISNLRNSTGYITLDPGYGNTGSCESAVTFIDGDIGILRHRGYPIEELASKFKFLEIAHLLIYGELPSKEELDTFRYKIRNHSLLHEDMKGFFANYPKRAHPMAILSSMVCSMSVYHPELIKSEMSEEEFDTAACHLMSKVRVLATYAYKSSIGQAFVNPRNEYNYIENFLHMMFSTAIDEYEVTPAVEKAMNILFILHADHEQNCSTSTVRMVGSSKANLFASISAGVCALWGPLHGGANQAVLEMLEEIKNDNCDYKKYILKAKDKNDPFRLMGFGHRVYKNFDPRATILKQACDDVLHSMGIKDPLLEIAKGLEEAALTDPYFIEKKLYPNVDFYSGIIFRAIGIPINMFTVMFSLGRLPGWIAQWKEMNMDPAFKIARPRQIYVGEQLRQPIRTFNDYTSASDLYKKYKQL